MHSALLIPELVHEICLNVARVDPFCTVRPPRANVDVDGKSLANLARTCIIFKDPSLDILWKQQRGLSNLITCLPHTAWQRSPPDPQGESFLQFLRPLTEEDLERPGFYARRVRKLSCISSEMHTYRELGPCLFQACRSISSNLQDLRWSPEARHELLPDILAISSCGVDIYLSSALAPTMITTSQSPLQHPPQPLCAQLRYLSSSSADLDHATRNAFFIHAAPPLPPVRRECASFFVVCADSNSSPASSATSPCAASEPSMSFLVVGADHATPNPSRITRSILALIDHAHALVLASGDYAGRGRTTCAPDQRSLVSHNN
ncbi:hypothetical protein B0H16DRAFT_1712832 [Mycena metata]|uniref:Uncharacterized protein n=1 Tax=Mycena metata TaxID=1033252 RepID=A0AAD7NVC3_9AGAR|nr:hypothetical protein B0H16DRAFT_1712832 [Mycena metata]